MHSRRSRSRSSRCIFRIFIRGSRFDDIRIFRTSRSARYAGLAAGATTWRCSLRRNRIEARRAPPAHPDPKEASMDLRKLKKLIDLVEDSGIAELEVTE